MALSAERKTTPRGISILPSAIFPPLRYHAVGPGLRLLWRQDWISTRRRVPGAVLLAPGARLVYLTGAMRVVSQQTVGRWILFPEMGTGARSAMAGPVYHFDSGNRSSRKFPAEFDGAWFVYEWERGWIRTLRLDAVGRLRKIEPFAPELKWKRPISMAFGPDGALYVIDWGTAWFNNTDAQLVRVDSGE